MNRSLPLLCGALALTLMSACGSGSGTTSTDAFSTNGHARSRSSFEDDLKAYSDNVDFATAIATQITVQGTSEGSLNAEFVRQTIGFEIDYELIHEELAAQKVAISPSAATEGARIAAERFGGDAVWAKFPKNFRDRQTLAWSEVIQLRLHYAGVTSLDDAALQAAFAADSTPYSRRCLSHILVATLDEATQIEGQLKTGEDFATIAKAKSIDTGSGANGGELRNQADGTCQTKDEIDSSYIGEFAAAADAATVGVPTDPVQSQYGFHIILVTKVEDVLFNDAKAAVKNTLLSKGNDKFTAWQKDALAKAQITVDPRYGEWDAKTSSVVATTTGTADIPVK
ncbi:MAG: peptidylprolyl isomerase [Acidimicrobiales bacterium]